MEEKKKKDVKKEEQKSSDNENTMIYKPVKKKGKNKKKKKHPRLRLLLKILLITFILLVVIGGGIFAAILYRCIWGDWAIDEETLVISYTNSTMYDINGNEILSLSGEENREIISKEEMSPYLFDAFISIEDERFESHNGVDWKRTAGALFTFATNGGESSYGGSTITQQLVKNLTGEDASSAFDGALRKIKEIVRAYQVEDILSKDQILEMYLNLIPLGGGGKNLYGVQTAARFYFDKEAKDLTLVESAYLAGITHAPNTYNPFTETDKTERINKRVKTVLGKMLELGKITQEEYDAAIQEVDAGIKFTQGTVYQNNNLTYHAEAAVDEILEDLMELNNWSRDEAKMHLYGDGYQIYTTYDPNVQSAIDEQYINNSSKWTTKYKTVTREDNEGNKTEVEVRRESAMVIINPETGYVVAGTSGFGEKTTSEGFNRMVKATHSPGSAIKPLAVIGPSLEEGLITAASVEDDTPTTFGDYSPRNDSSGYYGLMNVRYILRVSRNIPEVKFMKRLTVAKSLEYLANFGLDTTNEQQDGLSLALGGMSVGPTVLEMAGAYATIANYGEYIEPTFYIRITDIDGNEVIGEHQEKRRVLSEQNAWILQTLLQEPTGTGLTGSSGATGTGARVKGQDTAGKTGTTNDTKAVWFCGFTPYYAAAVWMGYDIETDGRAASGSGMAARLWGAVMNTVHKDLDSAEFERPDGIKTATVCSKSGLLATDLCREAEGTQVYTEYFAEGTVPTEKCDTHVKAKVCNKTGKLASDNCTDTSEKVFITRENSEKDTSWKKANDAKYMLPTETCEECKKEDKPKENVIANEITTDTNTDKDKDKDKNTTTNTDKDKDKNTNTDKNNTNTNTDKGNTNTNTNTNDKNTNTDKNNTNTDKNNTNTSKEPDKETEAKPTQNKVE